MKKPLTLVFIVLVAGLVGFGLFKSMGPHETHGVDGAENSTKMTKNDDHQDHANLFMCPMHPQITSDKPGQTCPICGMDLVPASQMEDMDQDEESDPAVAVDGRSAFRLSESQVQLIGVKTEKAVRRNLFKKIRAPGRVAFDPELYTLQTEFIEALKQWKEVKDSPLKHVRRSTKEMIESSKTRLRVMGLSESEIRSLEQSGQQSEELIVTGKGGAQWIYADIYESELGYIKPGLAAEVSANFLQGKVLPAKVLSLDQVINTATRTAKVRLKLLSKNDTVRAESYVNVTVLTPMGEHLVVPEEAIMDTGREQYVYVKKADGVFEPHKVTVLIETDTDAAIGSGISEGDEVVVGGNFMLDSESRLKAVISEAK